MMMKLLTALLFSAAVLSARADMHVADEDHADHHNHDGAEAKITPKVTPVEYQDKDGVSLTGFLALPDAAASSSSPLPAVIIVPDWDGVNYYEQQRATMIAKEMGWVALAADIYGTEHAGVIEGFDQLIQMSGLYRNEKPALFMQRIQAAVDYLRNEETILEHNDGQAIAVDPEKIALIGYCFGGSGALMYAVDETVTPVAAVASFHGGLGPHVFDHHWTAKTAAAAAAVQARQDGPPVVINRPKVLTLSGGLDDMASDIMDLEDALNNATNAWEITRYWGIEHAFTVFGDHRYNQWADHRSWSSMSQFFKEAMGEVTFAPQQPASVKVEPVPYVDETDGKQLQGYLARPEGQTLPKPAVVIIPDWDGVNQYEKERATLLAQEGYVAFAADIFGADLQQGMDFDTRIKQTNFYRSQNVDLFVSRMQRAVELVQNYEFVDADNIALIGYCFGGTGVVQYAFMGRSDVKLIAAYHGNVQEKFLPPIIQDVLPYTMILSGGEDDAHGNQTSLEANLNKGNAEWEITRYSGVFHGFTSWESNAYNLNADIRSWTAMLTAMENLMASADEGALTKDFSAEGSESGDASFAQNVFKAALSAATLSFLGTHYLL